MRIRLHGQADEFAPVLAAIHQVLTIRDVSRPYPTGHPPPFSASTSTPHPAPRTETSDDCQEKGPRIGTAERDELLSLAEALEELHVPKSTFFRWKALGRATQTIKYPNGNLMIRRAGSPDTRSPPQHEHLRRTAPRSASTRDGTARQARNAAPIRFGGESPAGSFARATGRVPSPRASDPSC
jgi:hypothetical protein